MNIKTTTILAVAIAGALALGACQTTDTSSFSGGGVKPYAHKTCVVTGNELGSMGQPIRKVYEGQEVKFCCKPCVKKFEANQTKYLSQL